MDPRDLVSFSRTVFWSLGLGGLRSRLGLEGSRSRALRLETLHSFFYEDLQGVLQKKRF